MDKSKGIFNDDSDDIMADEGSDEIDEGFLQVTAYNFKKEDTSHVGGMNASQDFMQMPHEGDESDSSSSDLDEGGRQKGKNHSYSDMDSHDFGNDQKDSSDYSDDNSFGSASQTG